MENQISQRIKIRVNGISKTTGLMVAQKIPNADSSSKIFIGISAAHYQDRANFNLNTAKELCSRRIISQNIGDNKPILFPVVYKYTVYEFLNRCQRYFKKEQVIVPRIKWIRADVHCNYGCTIHDPIFIE